MMYFTIAVQSYSLLGQEQALITLTYSTPPAKAYIK